MATDNYNNTSGLLLSAPATAAPTSLAAKPSTVFTLGSKASTVFAPEAQTVDKEKGGDATVAPVAEVRDGGWQGWMTVVGSFLIFFTTFGNVYSYGVYQDYYTRFYLTSRSLSTISWIGSFQMMMPFALSVFAGTLFDRGYFRHVMIGGSSIFALSIFMLSLAKPQQYYQIFLSQGVGIGLGTGLTFVPGSTCTVRHFPRRKALASGISLSGCAAGSIIFPIMINRLIPTVGFGNAVRATAYVSLGCLVVGNILMRTPPKSNSPNGVAAPKRSVLYSLRYLKEIPFVCALTGITTILLGSNFPSVYIQFYAIEHSVDSNLAFYSVAIANAGAITGRVLGNLLAYFYGPLNILVPSLLLTAATCWAVLGVTDAPSLVVVSIFYGIFSGACLSLVMVALASMSATPEEVGARSGLALSCGCIGALCSAPIQGALLGSTNNWIRPSTFAGVMMVVATVAWTIARQSVTKTKGTWRV